MATYSGGPLIPTGPSSNPAMAGAGPRGAAGQGNVMLDVNGRMIPSTVPYLPGMRANTTVNMNPVTSAKAKVKAQGGASATGTEGVSMVDPISSAFAPEAYFGGAIPSLNSPDPYRNYARTGPIFARDYSGGDPTVGGRLDLALPASAYPNVPGQTFPVPGMEAPAGDFTGGFLGIIANMLARGGMGNIGGALQGAMQPSVGTPGRPDPRIQAQAAGMQGNPNYKPEHVEAVKKGQRSYSGSASQGFSSMPTTSISGKVRNSYGDRPGSLTG